MSRNLPLGAPWGPSTWANIVYVGQWEEMEKVVASASSDHTATYKPLALSSEPFKQATAIAVVVRTRLCNEPAC